MKYEIKTRFTGDVQFAAEIDCDEDASRAVKIGLSVKWALKSDAYLRDADLRGAYLRDADLRDADLRGAYLRGAYLRGADLRDADLRDADLRDADLRDADLRGADLRGAYLRGADLRDADLRGAYLRGANLGFTDLIDGGQRSDGFRFVGWVKDNTLQIRAGCRSLTIDEARKHWEATRGGTPLGNETFAILDHIEAVARIRGLVIEQAAAAE